MVTLVGAGPGDPGLLTCLGKERLMAAEVVLYDRLVSPEILSFIPPSALAINVGKEVAHHPVKQSEINEMLLHYALAGKRVVRLKGGDPFVFGRGGEELDLLAQVGLDFEVVPGITSAIAGPAYAGIPVTHRGLASSFTVITGHRRENQALEIDYEALVATGSTLVFLMSVATLGEISQGLQRAGMPVTMPVALVEKATCPDERSFLSNLRDVEQLSLDEKIVSPSLFIVGPVCAKMSEYHWRRKGPLTGKTIVVTRARSQASSLSKSLKDLGAKVIEAPAITMEDLTLGQGAKAFKESIERLDSFDWLCFTSVNGVEIFFQGLKREEKDIRCLGKAKLAAVGSQTAKALKNLGLQVDFCPSSYDSQTMAEELLSQARPGEKFLLLRGAKGLKILPQALKEAGLYYQEVKLYNTRMIKEEVPQKDLERADLITFTSASTVEGFCQAYPELMGRLPALAIGPVTAQKALDAGFNVEMAPQATVADMVELLKEGSFFSKITQAIQTKNHGSEDSDGDRA